MNCPYCNKEMEKGFINQSQVFYPIRWRPAPKEEPILFHSNKGSIKLTSVTKSGQVIVHYCATCHKFVIDQDEIET